MIINPQLVSRCLKSSHQAKNWLKRTAFTFKSPSFMFLKMVDTDNSSFNVENIIIPPAAVRGMKKLDRDAFNKEISIPYILVPLQKMQEVSKLAKPLFFKMPKFAPVQEDGDKKKIFLHPAFNEERLSKVTKVLTLVDMKEVLYANVTVSYENWTCDQIFKAVLPPESTGNVASFSIVGHIIHLNLKPDLIDYKALIGQVLLDKYSNIKTVVNKSQIIENEFRNLNLELLAGEPNYDVVVKENNCRYAFDFSKVFWNPRLVHEHAEIVKMANPYDSVYDVFAGVGPFSVPLAKKKCDVHANDLNPDSYHWLCHNAKLNKASEHVQCYNLDGREFIQKVVKNGLTDFWNKEEDNRQFHVIMNLPACALEFLDAFEGLFKGEKLKNVGNMPHVYCHFFKKKEEDVRELMTKYFDEDTLNILQFTEVRLVAPNKMMMRVSYQIPKRILFKDDKSCERPTKKLKCDNGAL